jgi:hypothetical protein
MKLIGECNLCGACCFTQSGAVCEHLEILSRPGSPHASRCSVYAERYNGLPIRMIGKNGRILSGYYCAKDSAAEVKVIIEMGIKRGVCSLRRPQDPKTKSAKVVTRGDTTERSKRIPPDAPRRSRRDGEAKAQHDPNSK